MNAEDTRLARDLIHTKNKDLRGYIVYLADQKRYAVHLDVKTTSGRDFRVSIGFEPLHDLSNLKPGGGFTGLSLSKGTLLFLEEQVKKDQK